MNENVPLCRSRSSIWTVLAYILGDVRVLACLLILRFLSLPVDAANFIAANGICVKSTGNAQQTEESWIRFSECFLPTMSTSFHNTGFVYNDFHTLRVTKQFIELAYLNTENRIVKKVLLLFFEQNTSFMKELGLLTSSPLSGMLESQLGKIEQSSSLLVIESMQDKGT